MVMRWRSRGDGEVEETERAVQAVAMQLVEAGHDWTSAMAEATRRVARRDEGPRMRGPRRPAAGKVAITAALVRPVSPASLHLDAEPGASGADPDDPAVAEALAARGGGRALPDALRRDLESVLGIDLGRVSLHTDAAAAAAAAAVHARAFTVGEDVYFADGAYRPESAEGRELIAHEVTHVAQQASGRAGSAGAGVAINADVSLEQEAREMGARMRNGATPSPAPSYAPAPSREAAPSRAPARAPAAIGRIGGGVVQRDPSIEPTHPNAQPRELTPAQMRAAIRFNQRTVTDPAEISMIRDVIGRSREPAVVDEEFVRALVHYQAMYGLTQDGQLGPRTRQQLGREIVASDANGDAATQQSLRPGTDLRTELIQLIDAGDRTYATFRTRIRASTDVKRSTALADVAFLGRLRGHLPWNDFARCVELLGRRAPAFGELVGRGDVRAQLRAAWTASGTRVSAPNDGGAQHEEGGWIYLELETGNLAFRRQAPGGQAGINLAAPPVIAGHIVVAKFHTHPNLGPNWDPGPSAIDDDGNGTIDRGDTIVDPQHGVPDIVVNSPTNNPAVFGTQLSGPARRAHLAGNQGLPGAAGGLAP